MGEVGAIRIVKFSNVLTPTKWGEGKELGICLGSCESSNGGTANFRSANLSEPVPIIPRRKSGPEDPQA